ncbi:hypothetical protein I2486_19355 [Cellulophaga sp. E16_2]|uniref:Outer membrane lipoprotein-sorting protein n=1 Tax=Cellulophaga algicola (strain DSM 14237 / IC166 / ACAM 630) TaxID=688270 RepID=E6XCA6_CELAD|nr:MULTISPECIES: hypothetical protein [Cellulophaga]ADV51159.1 hypothetical protein Celal_3915 [Cellulophaga algicola DSM 14237]MBO0593561.1 hypothetical protein [Cellulophaga sp. E16_2]
MKLQIKNMLASVMVAFVFTFSITAQNTDTKSAELIAALESVNGGYNKLSSKKDVQFNYVYDNFEKGKDVSLERHIFNGEQSWASYSQHDLNVLPGKKGVAVQSLVDGIPALTLDGKAITDAKALGGTKFLREVNFYWFAMMYKLKNEGANYKFLGTEKVGKITYDKVSLTYSSDVTKKEQNDEYILYFNPETHLVDQFFFSLPAWGINTPVLKMTLAYEEIDGILVSTVRKGFGPDGSPMGVFTFSDVKFNNGFKKEAFLLN